ncbi:hypothetical protein ACLMJK_005496 [Lecanora helva]
MLGTHDRLERDEDPNEAQDLLSYDDRMNMANLSPQGMQDKTLSSISTTTTYSDGPTNTQASLSRAPTADGEEMALTEGRRHIEYRVYKLRWFGLIQLILLNIIVAWDWLSYAAVANTAADFFSTDSSTINWLSTSSLFAFVAASPATLWTLHKGGPRSAIITSSLLILCGNWIRYAGSRTSPPSFGLTMFGQIIIGLAQPFVLSAPTQYSNLWFTPAGRVSTIAVASLANPFGGALGQLIDPFLAAKASDIPTMTLCVAIISTVATIPSFFIPAKPPTPVSPSSTRPPPSFTETLRLLSVNPTFYLLFIPFAIYVGFFNSTASLLTQILTPYNFSETSSGIAGAVLILVGLVSAAITSPIMDRTKAYLPFIKIAVPIIATCYFAFIWAPGTRTIVAPYIVLAILGAASFSLVPIALDYLVENTYPAGPEAGSTICWAGGQLVGGIFVVVSDALKEGKDADPPFTMRKALVFQAIVAVAAVPSALALGWVGKGRNRTLDIGEG